MSLKEAYPMARKSLRSIRKSIAVFTAVGLLGLTTGCSSPTSNQAEDGPVEIRFSWWGNATRAELTNKAIKEFEAANPNIKVKPEYGDIGGYFDKLATQVAANDAPDVITMGGAYRPSTPTGARCWTSPKLKGPSTFPKWTKEPWKTGRCKANSTVSPLVPMRWQSW
ncbi:UNVERIFIED_CONTAM: hypothetical protein ABIE34_000240 [Jeotgalibacillus campisalis]